MAKNIDLENLKRKGLAEVFVPDLTKKYIGPNPLFPGDPTTWEKVSYEEGDPQLDLIFNPQTYQELGIKKGDMIFLDDGRKEWRVVEVGGLDDKVSVSIALA